MTGSSGIRTTLDDSALLVELNRPEKRNALDETLQGALLQVFTDAAHDRKVRGVILTAAGEVFSAGGDLSRFERDWEQAEFRANSHELTRLTSSIERLEKPVIAESMAQSLLVGTEDHTEGVRAARERRAPSFTGR
jgi:enoyl-CoA hydratase/carnithine racemase